MLDLGEGFVLIDEAADADATGVEANGAEANGVEANGVEAERKPTGDSGRNPGRSAERKATRAAIQWEQAAPGERLDDLVSLQLLARRLRTLRLMSGLTLDEVADRADLSRSTLYQLERAATSRPRGQTLHRLAEAYGVSIDDLLLHVPEHRPPEPRNATNHTAESHASGSRRLGELERSQPRALTAEVGRAMSPIVRWGNGAEPQKSAPDQTKSGQRLHAGPGADGMHTQPADRGQSSPERAPAGGYSKGPVGGLPKKQWAALPRVVREAVLRATNAQPELFQRWTERDWLEFVTDSLTNVLGPDGLLPEGAIVQRARQWQAVHQLRGVLASPLAELAAGLVAQLHASLIEPAPTANP
jgi:transcriptional regulator with XRE-family HTH domain